MKLEPHNHYTVVFSEKMFCTSELNITVGERGAGSIKRWLPCFIHKHYLLYTRCFGVNIRPFEVFT